VYAFPVILHFGLQGVVVHIKRITDGDIQSLVLELAGTNVRSVLTLYKPGTVKLLTLIY
jgi:hypothetical protein